jgi:hypothetical protein
MLPLGFKAVVRSGLAALRRDSPTGARHKTQRYLNARGGKPACLHLGCGGNVMEGWLNVDLVPADREVIAFDLRR